MPFVLTWSPFTREPAGVRSTPETALDDTVSFWEEWSGAARRSHPWDDAVRRSLHHPQGAHVRADRRDRGGANDVAPRGDRRRPELGLPLLLAPRRHADPARVHPRRVHGGGAARGATGSCVRSPDRPTTSRSCTASPASDGSSSSSCPGSRGTSPRVRCGSGTARLISSSSTSTARSSTPSTTRGGRASGRPTTRGRSPRKTLDWLESGGSEPDEGIWEVRGPRRHFTHSKIMAWVAFDRAVKTVQRLDREGPIDRWRATAGGRSGRRSSSRASTPELGSFVQYFGSDRLDASLLLIPLVGFLPADDPRVSAPSPPSSAT